MPEPHTYTRDVLVRLADLSAATGRAIVAGLKVHHVGPSEVLSDGSPTYRLSVAGKQKAIDRFYRDNDRSMGL